MVKLTIAFTDGNSLEITLPHCTTTLLHLMQGWGQTFSAVIYSS